MSIADKITRLQTAKTNIANAITNKGGTVSSGDGYEEFASDIATIQSGGIETMAFELSNIFNTTNARSYFNPIPTLPTKMKITAPNCLNFSGAFREYIQGDRGGLTCEELELDFPRSLTYGVDMSYFSGRNSHLKKVILNDGFKIRGNRLLDESNVIEEIVGRLDMSLQTGYDQYFWGSTSIKSISIVQNTISTNQRFASCSLLTDTSLISIANGLNGSVSDKTITFHATPKARLSTIMGNVVDGTFIANDSGTTTLQDFITNTKGWTLG